MRRLIVLGGFGFFGSAIVRQLRAEGLSPLIGSRRGEADIRLDVESPQSLRETLRWGDVVVDAVGPFQDRGPALVEAAIDLGADVIDIADSLAYVRAVHDLRDRIEAAGIRVFTACSSFSAITAAMVRSSGITDPVRVTAFLSPATRHSAVAGTAASLFYSVGNPIEVFDDGRLAIRTGWKTSRGFSMAEPVGRITGYAFESADSITIPRIWPSLRTVEAYVDTNVRTLNFVFSLAARWPGFRKLLAAHQRRGLVLARLLGRSVGGVGYEIEAATGNVVRLSLVSEQHGYVTAIAPAVLAARAIIEGRIQEQGFLRCEGPVEPKELVRYLQELGVTLHRETSDGCRT